MSLWMANSQLADWLTSLQHFPLGNLFGFLNAGVVIDAEAAFRLVQDPVALGGIAGLVLGKPVGLWAGVRLGEMTGNALITAKLAIVAASALAAVGGFLVLYQAGTKVECTLDSPEVKFVT